MSGQTENLASWPSVEVKLLRITVRLVDSHRRLVVMEASLAQGCRDRSCYIYPRATAAAAAGAVSVLTRLLLYPAAKRTNRPLTFCLHSIDLGTNTYSFLELRLVIRS